MKYFYQIYYLKKSNHLLKRKIYNPKTLKQLARENIKLEDKELEKEIAKSMINPYYFTDRDLQIGFNINLDSHNINHANSILTITPNFSEFGIEIRYVNENFKKMTTIYARLIKHYKFNYHFLFSPSFSKRNEADQRSDEAELFIDLNTNHNLRENGLSHLVVKSKLEHQIQIRETKVSGWIFDKINSMEVRFYKNGELNGSS